MEQCKECRYYNSGQGGVECLFCDPLTDNHWTEKELDQLSDDMLADGEGWLPKRKEQKYDK